MIHIEKGELVKDHPELLVYSPTGDYEEVDLIECCEQSNLTVPVCAFSAQYVKFGNAVYQQEQPLTPDQVAALEVNAPMEVVLNNEDLIDGKIDPLSLSQNSPVLEDVADKITKPTKKPKVVSEVVEVLDEPAVGDVVGEIRE